MPQTFCKKGQVVLVDLCLNPDGFQVGDIEQRHAFLDILTLANVLTNNVPANRRTDPDVRVADAGCQDFFDLVIADTEQLQPSLCAGQQRFIASLIRIQKALHRNDQIGTVDRGKDIAFMHHATCLIDK